MLRVTSKQRIINGLRHYSVLPEALSPTLVSHELPHDVTLSETAKQPQLTSAATENNIKIAALETFQPTSSLAVVLAAGSRFEPHNGRGLAHILKTLCLRVISPSYHKGSSHSIFLSPLGNIEENSFQCYCLQRTSRMQPPVYSKPRTLDSFCRISQRRTVCYYCQLYQSTASS
jgi:hypothetical protein